GRSAPTPSIPHEAVLTFYGSFSSLPVVPESTAAPPRPLATRTRTSFPSLEGFRLCLSVRRSRSVPVASRPAGRREVVAGRRCPPRATGLEHGPPGGGEDVRGEPVEGVAGVKEEAGPGLAAVLGAERAQGRGVGEARPRGRLDLDRQ